MAAHRPLTMSALVRLGLVCLVGFGLAAAAVPARDPARSTAGEAAAQSPEARSFQVPIASGYGIDECVADGGDCGRAAADSWCRAQGYGVTAGYGSAEPGTLEVRCAS